MKAIGDGSEEKFVDLTHALSNVIPFFMCVARGMLSGKGIFILKLFDSKTRIFKLCIVLYDKLTKSNNNKTK